jgi:TonB family protein
MLKPDPTRLPRVVHTRLNGPEWAEPDVGEGVADAAEVLEFHRPEALAPDLALDLRLHEILEEALLATAASGAVIALASGDQMVCRATAGEKSPKIGVYLNTHSGLSGLCIQTHEMQQCDDALLDSRVNAEACRELGIRSIVVLPVLGGERMWGILEVFSSVPRAFGNPDIEGLHVLCRRIAHTVREAMVEPGRPSPDASFSTSRPPSEVPASPETMASEIVRASAQMAAAGRRRDYRTSALTAAVIALAVLLGWMVGRVGWSMATNRSPTQTVIAPEPVQTVEQATPKQLPAARVVADVIKPAESTTVPPVASKPASKAKAQPVEPPGSLVVYENGKVVFRMEPPIKPQTSSGESSPVQSAMTREEESSGEADSTSPLVGTNYLLERVEPDYPEDAKQQHIQGPVVLKALVNADGSVREVKVASGDSHLVKAASDAVRQWRFRPHLRAGKPIEFETRITVNFQLPESSSLNNQ